MSGEGARQTTRSSCDRGSNSKGRSNYTDISLSGLQRQEEKTVSSKLRTTKNKTAAMMITTPSKLPGPRNSSPSEDGVAEIFVVAICDGRQLTLNPCPGRVQEQFWWELQGSSTQQRSLSEN